LILSIAGLGASGVYHVTAADCLSKYDFGRRLAKLFGFAEDLVQPVRVDQAGLIARRPHNLCLDGAKLKAETKLEVPGVNEGLARFRALRESGFVAQLKRVVAAVEGPG
jgi:dTDP-4-dehydrorhamnose reductase